MKNLPTWAELCLWDRSGRCRCPRCGKYRKRSEIPNDQPTTVVLSNATISVAPGCQQCLGRPQLGMFEGSRRE